MAVFLSSDDASMMTGPKCKTLVLENPITGETADNVNALFVL
jgi:hypothetical protein